jgi:rRNA-processing protein FCF1
MEILLDTNFLLTSVREKVFFDSLADELFDESLEWVVPQEVLNELGNIKDTKGVGSRDRDAAKVCFEILQSLNPKIVDLGSRSPNVDMAIVNYLLDRPSMVLATLDKGLKGRVSNPILTLRGKKTLALV